MPLQLAFLLPFVDLLSFLQYQLPLDLPLPAIQCNATDEKTTQVV